MFSFRKLLSGGLYKSFVTGQFSANVPKSDRQFLAISDSSIDYYLIKPNISITLVSKTELTLPILSSCLIRLDNSEQNLIGISIEAANQQIELIILEFNDLSEQFEPKAKFSFLMTNKKRKGLDFQTQGLRLFSHKTKIIASSYQNYIGVLNYDLKNDMIAYEKEVKIIGFYGDITFDESGKYFFVVCNNEDTNKIIYKTLARVDLINFEVSEAKICVGEENDKMVVKNLYLSFDYHLFVCEGSSCRLEKVIFEKKNKNDKKKQNEKNSWVCKNGILTNFSFFDEFLLLGLDNGSVMIKNTFEIENGISGNHIYAFPNLKDCMYWEIWSENHELICLACTTNDLRVYSLEYQKDENGEIIMNSSIDNKKIITHNLMNSLVDCAIVQTGGDLRVFGLLNDGSFNLRQEISLKEIEFGLKPNFNFHARLDLGKCKIENFWLFDWRDVSLLFFSINDEILFFLYSLEQGSLKQINFRKLGQIPPFKKMIEIYQFSEGLLCFVSTEGFFLMALKDNFLINSVNYSKTDSNIILSQMIKPFKNTVYLVFQLADNSIHLHEFVLGVGEAINQNIFEGIVKQSFFERKIQSSNIESLFIFSSNSKLSIIQCFFTQFPEILEFSYENRKFLDMVTTFLPETQINSLETLFMDIILISSASGELFIYKIAETELLFLEKWQFNNNSGNFKLKRRDQNSVYFYSLYETFLIEVIESDKIRCFKILFPAGENPQFVCFSLLHNQEFCLEGRDLFVWTLNANGKKTLVPEVTEKLVRIECQQSDKIPKAKKGKSNLLQRFRRLCYSEKNRLLYLISHNLWILSYDPFIYQIQSCFDLSSFLYKKESAEYELVLLKLIKFPGNFELLCISSIRRNQTESEESKSEDHVHYRLSFCELVSRKLVSLDDGALSLRFASEQFIKKKESPITDILFLFESNVFLIAVGEMLEVYSYVIKEEGEINISFKMVTDYKIGKKLICLDGRNSDLILVGDYMKSLYFFRLEISNLNEKVSIKLVLLKAEKEQRLLSAGRILDDGNAMGIDKYGDCFITKVHSIEENDSNYNAINSALVSFRDSSRNIIRIPSKFNRARQLFFAKNKENNEEASYFLIITLQGSAYQVKFVNLVYLMDNQEIHLFIEMFTKFLMEQKSLKISLNEANVENYYSMNFKTKNFVNMAVVDEFLEENAVVQEKLLDVFLKGKPNFTIEFTLKDVLKIFNELKVLN